MPVNASSVRTLCDICYQLPPIDTIPDGPEDQPTPGSLLVQRKGRPLNLPELISGAATWSHFYNEENELTTDVPLRTIRLALRYGIRAFDTAPFYDNSEIVLGTALKALEQEFPRATYQLITKRLHTQYLDVVYLHDVEFVARCGVAPPRREGNHLSALGAEAGTISALRTLQANGLIRHVGISGFPLPSLLRIALLVLKRTGRPLDIIQTYSHLTLQNSTLLAFAEAFRTRARVVQLIAASPLGMGLLAPPPAPPSWHPAPDAVRAAAREAVAAVAVAWSVRAAGESSDGDGGSGRMPVVVGMSNLQEVHAAVAAWRWARDEGRREELERKAALAQDVFERTGTAGWTWSSGNWA
ncbi:NADP-dependent oxidoreductase domain-containing protein [Lactifluus volemus]|nr:NADP-dependent oxidoreductase domain-containing protein [Lactifluus volemus]